MHRPARFALGAILLPAALASGAACKGNKSKPPDQDHVAPQTGPDESEDPSVDSKAKLDLYGDALPAMARARLGSLRMVDRALRNMIFSADGSQLISNSKDGYQVWNLTDAKRIKLLEHDAASQVMATTPDGSQLATGVYGEGEIALWDPKSETKTNQFKAHKGEVTGLCYLSAGKLISTADDGELKIWNISEGNEELSVQGDWSEISALACSADGKWIAFGTSDGDAQLLAAGSDEVITLGSADKGISSAAVHPTSKGFAFGSEDEKIYIWSTPEPGEPKSFVAHDRTVLSLRYGPEGKKLYSAGGDSLFRIWNAKSGAMAEERLGVDGLDAQLMTLSPDGMLMASWSQHSGERGSEAGRFWLWNASTGDMLLEPKRHRLPLTSLAYSPDGKTIATASEDATIQLWDVATGKAGETIEGADSSVNALAYTKSGAKLVSAGKDSLLRVRKATGGKASVPIEGVGGAVNRFVLTPDGSRVITGDQIGRVWAWDLKTGAQIQAYDRQGYSAIYDLALSADGRFLAIAGSDKLVRVVDLTSGQEVAKLEPEGAAANFAVAFSPDGSTLATGGDDHKIHLWKSSDWSQGAVLEGHDGTVRCLDFSPDGKTLASGGNDEMVHLWDPASGELIQALEGHQGVITDLSFSPDGSTLASASRDRTALIWSLGSRS